MDKDNSFLLGKTDMDPNMPDRSHQHTVVLDDGAHASTSYSRVSPPKAVIDSSPLQSAMDKNKESLKVKLLVRRSLDQLVQQGIMPPLKTSPAIYEQRRQLERAKTGDLLKAKIKKRPDRVELEQRHILEHCDSNIDPSLAEKRRMLEKALLVDHLNSKISHRPGPLDLIGKNILHVEEPIERMVKEGLVDYALTFDESNVSVSTPTTVGEGEDSLSSEGESLHSVAVALVSQPLVQATHGGTLLQHQIQLQPIQTLPQAPGHQQQQQQQPTVPEFFALKPTIPIVTNDGTVLAAIATPVVATTIATVSGASIATIAEVPMEQGTSHTPSTNSNVNSSSTSTTTNLRPILPTPSANASGDLLSARPPLTMTTIPSDIKLLSAPSVPSGGGGGKDKSSKKKSKSKSITKAKPMKFHEYKGPPSAYKSSLSASATPGHGMGPSSDNNYQLIMQQQTLLSYLEDMCKKPTSGGMPSPSSREQQQGAPDLEDIAGSDLTPLDSPLSGAGGGGGGATSTVRGKGTGGGSSGGGNTPSSMTTLGVSDLALETLNKLKVSQLKRYCKQYNLAVSGTKSNLIERLKPFMKSIDPSLASPCGSVVSATLSTAGAATPTGVDQELEDSLLAEQQKRIAELQLQLKRSQEELEQFRSLCTNQFVAPGPVMAETPMVTNSQMPPVPPPPPPLPSTQLSTVMVGSPYSVSAGGGIGERSVEPSGSGECGGAGEAPHIEPADTTTIPGLEESFFLDGLTAADSTTVDYGHDMEEILHPELTGSALPVDRSPTHLATLDKVLGQVQPTISSITMNADPGGGRNGVSSATAGGGMRGSLGGGAIVGGAGGPRAVVGDMHDLSLSLKSVNFDTVTATGDDSMQQDTIMLNDFGDIDLVDFHMHSLDSDGPFPMLTNHDPDPTSTTDHHIQSLPHQQHTASMSLFAERDDPNRGEQLLSSEFVNQQQHMHSDSMHLHQQQSLLTTDADTDSVLTANNCHRMVLDCAQDKPMFSYLPENSLLDYFNEDCNGHDYEIKHLEY
uniref:SAP domain-containing protein n=1 Tax=Anopheles atroparvus TaxID=41427 RepID=A0A182JCD1_ANOAO